MMNKACSVLLLLAASMFVIVSGCGDVKEHPIRGKVTWIANDKARVTLDHETIPGFMGAMQMDFAVSDPSVLKGINVGDEVEGSLQDTEELTITRLQKQ